MTGVDDEGGLVDIATAARLLGVSELFVTRLIAQGSLTTVADQLSRLDVVTFGERRRANIDGLQEITDADEELGLLY